MPQIQDGPMTQDEVFAELARRGATHATVRYSGGNDEGGADGIEIRAGEEVLADIDEHYFPWDYVDGKRVDRELTAEEISNMRLATALCKPFYDKWGGFSGDFDVCGTLTWDVAAGEFSADEQTREFYSDTSW